MSATEILRRLLDERGVWWDYGIGGPSTTRFNVNGVDITFTPLRDGLVCSTILTPEQAIAATLGAAYEPPVAAHWDGDTLTLTIPCDPSCIRVQRSAEQPCKVYADESKVIAATLGSFNCTNGERTETCHIDLVGYNQREDRFQCRSCDWSMWFKRGTWPRFNYCPNCGRRIEQ